MHAHVHANPLEGKVLCSTAVESLGHFFDWRISNTTTCNAMDMVWFCAYIQALLKSYFWHNWGFSPPGTSLLARLCHHYCHSWLIILKQNDPISIFFLMKCIKIQHGMDHPRSLSTPVWIKKKKNPPHNSATTVISQCIIIILTVGVRANLYAPQLILWGPEVDNQANLQWLWDLWHSNWWFLVSKFKI